MMKRNKAILCALASIGFITSVNTVSASAMTKATTTSITQTKAKTASEVLNLIYELPYSITLENKDKEGVKVKEARAAYDSLEQKEKDKIYKNELYILTRAEERLNQIEKDEATVKLLIDKIEELKIEVEYDKNKKQDGYPFSINNDILKSKKEEIQEIRRIYNELDYSLRYVSDSYVTNYYDLYNMECRLVGLA